MSVLDETCGHGCVIASHKGQGTNGHCTCDERKLRRAVRAYRARLAAVERERDEARSNVEVMREGLEVATTAFEQVTAEFETAATDAMSERDALAARVAELEAALVQARNGPFMCEWCGEMKAAHGWAACGDCGGETHAALDAAHENNNKGDDQ